MGMLKSVFGSSDDGKFGTFAGVFTPSILTILGVIMYLRFGWVVGQAGLMGALLIVLMAHLITIATGLSICAIATNQTIKTGGAYFMISRSLGLEIGGAIGIPLFLGQALSISLYVMGFTEAFLAVKAFAGYDPRLVSTVVLVLLTGISVWSSGIAIKTQYIVMLAIVLSLVSFVFGADLNTKGGIDMFFPQVDGKESVGFGPVFAVFFPAVTGIMAGVSMSGDLRDPRRAIPRGTMAAIFVGMAVYLLIPIVLAFKASSSQLRTDMFIMRTMALSGPLIIAGIWGATLSSAIGSILGAPRTLQALAMDGVMPKFLARGSGPTNEPRVGTLISAAIALVGIWMGDLNFIAPILTMFFLVTYGMTNLACALEKWADSPSFRPEFKTPAWVSLFGAIACFYMMTFINMPAAIAACGVALGIYFWLQRKTMETTWGDARHGIWAALVRLGLLQLRRLGRHPKNWRPNVIVLGGTPTTRSHLIDVALWLGGEKGLVTYFYLLQGEVRELQERRNSLMKTLDTRMARTHPNLLVRVEVCANSYQGVRSVAQSYGLAGFESNTVVMGWGASPDRAQEYGNLIYDLSLLDKCLALVAFDETKKFGRQQRIDVWWGGMDNNGGLMLLITHLLLSQPAWRLAEARVKMIVSDPAREAETRQMVQGAIDNARIKATAEIIVHPQDGSSIADIIAQNSVRADLIIMGLRPPDPNQGEAWVERVNQLIERLPTVLLVRASAEFEGAKMLFEEDEHAAIRRREEKAKRRHSEEDDES